MQLHLLIEGSLAGRPPLIAPGEIAGADFRHAQRRSRYSGTLIGESLRVGAEPEGILLTVTKVCRVRVEDEPQLWTLIYFEVAAARSADLARVLSRVLERDGSRRCDFRSDDEVFLVFCDRVFRYWRGDRTARSAAEDYARSLGSG